VTPYTSRRFEITLPESEPRTTTGSWRRRRRGRR
jgi:hypothetical protein